MENHHRGRNVSRLKSVSTHILTEFPKSFSIYMQVPQQNCNFLLTERSKLSQISFINLIHTSMCHAETSHVKSDSFMQCNFVVKNYASE